MICDFLRTTAPRFTNSMKAFKRGLQKTTRTYIKEDIFSNLLENFNATICVMVDRHILFIVYMNILNSLNKISVSAFRVLQGITVQHLDIKRKRF